MPQRIYAGKDAYCHLDAVLRKAKISKYMLVCDQAYKHLCFSQYIEEIAAEHVKFQEFASNPLYEDVLKGVEMFRREACDGIVAVGGGSAIDVAKCIKLFCKMDLSKDCLRQPFFDSQIPLIAIPTTAGTGSESTRYAVIYKGGEKQSITHESIRPGDVILEASTLKTLPLFQKKCTLLDALCQGVESWWSVNSTPESKAFSRSAVKMIAQNWRMYLSDDNEEVREIMMRASNDAGQAINITQTTAAHAMSYKITSLYGIPHGYAVAICLPKIWRYMLSHANDCIDPHGVTYLFGVWQDIAEAIGVTSPQHAIEWFEAMLQEMHIPSPEVKTESELALLAASVNPVRLKNNPVALREEALRALYIQIMK